MAKKQSFTLVKDKPDCILAIRTMFIVSKLFGCNLFHLPTDRYSTEPIHMKAIDYVIALLYVVLYSVFVFPFFMEIVFVRSGFLLSSGNFVIVCVVRIIFYFIIIAMLSCYIMETLNRSKMWKLLSRSYDFDEQAKSLGINVINNNKAFLVYALRIIVTQMTMFGLCGRLLSQQFEDYWLIFQFYVSYVMMDGCFTSTFCLYNNFIYHFLARFVNINDALRNLFDIRDKSTNQLDTKGHVPLSEADQLSTLKKLANLYDILTDCMRLHSECYSVQMSIITAVVFQFTLVCFYMIYQTVRPPYAVDGLLRMYAYSMRTFYFYSQILFAMKYGTKLSSEAKYTSHILSKALNLPLNKPTLNQLQLFLQQIGHSNTTVSCGLFAIDWTLFHMMIAAVVSYQVLFIQFDVLLMATTTTNYSF